MQVHPSTYVQWQLNRRTMRWAGHAGTPSGQLNRMTKFCSHTLYKFLKTIYFLILYDRYLIAGDEVD
jgi:hypothetical protein